jgi:hypothetical protein
LKLILLLILLTLTACSSNYVVEHRNILASFEKISSEICTKDLFKDYSEVGFNILDYSMCKSISKQYLIENRMSSINAENLINIRSVIISIITESKFKEVDNNFT